MGFEAPDGNAAAVKGAAGSFGTLGGQLSSHQATVNSGFTEASSTWRATREADFTAAGAGLKSQLTTAASVGELASDALRVYGQELREAKDAIAQLASQAVERRREAAMAARHAAVEGGGDGPDPEAGPVDISDLLDQADDVRRRLKAKAQTSAAQLDAATNLLVPDGDRLSPEAIRRKVLAMTDVSATASAVAENALTSTQAWQTLGQVAQVAPHARERVWAAQFGLQYPDTIDPAQGLALNQRLDGILDPSLDPATQAKLIREFADSLSPEEQMQLALADPQRIGNLDGIPNNLRYFTNKVNIADALRIERDRLGDFPEGGPSKHDPAYAEWMRLKGRIKNYDSLLNDAKLDKASAQHVPYQVLNFAAPVWQDGRVTDDGRLAVVTGDLDQAKQVGMVVPGITNRIDNFGATLNMGQKAQQGVDGSATVAWLGYDTPEFDNMLTEDAADEGGADLAATIQGMQRAPGSQLSLMAHSYGTLVTSKALQQITARGWDLPDRVLLFGSPGLGKDSQGREITKKTDLGVPADYPMYAMRATGDFVSISAGHGSDPVGMDGIIRLDTNGPGFESVAGHSNYLKGGSVSLSNLESFFAGSTPTSVVDGEKNLVIGGPPLDEDGGMGPIPAAYNPNFRRLVDELLTETTPEQASAFIAKLQPMIALADAGGSPYQFGKLGDLVQLFRDASEESGLGAALTHDEFEEAIHRAGFSKTTERLTREKTTSWIDDLDGLDGLEIPIGPLGGGRRLRIPEGWNEWLAPRLAGPTGWLTGRLNDLAVEHLPSLDKILGAAEWADRQAKRAYDAANAVKDGWGQFKDGVGLVRRGGEEALRQGRDRLVEGGLWTLRKADETGDAIRDRVVDTTVDALNTGRSIAEETGGRIVEGSKWTVDRADDVRDAVTSGFGLLR